MIETDTKTIVTVVLIILIVVFIVLIIVQLSTTTVEPFGFIARQRIWSKCSMKNNENEPQEETETYVPPRSTLINRKDGLKYLQQDPKPKEKVEEPQQQEQFCKCKLSEQKKKDRKINDIDAIKDDKLKEVKQLETPLTETFVTTRVNNKFDILKGDARSSQAAQLTDPANIGMSDKIKTFMSKLK